MEPICQESFCQLHLRPKLFPYFASNRNLDELSYNITQSFEYAIEQKADVVSCSWSGRFSDDKELHANIRKAVDNGIVVSWFHYPEHYPDY